nr:MAG TPA_asm: hypothetical protein [Caudoviricetes sp.]
MSIANSPLFHFKKTDATLTGRTVILGQNKARSRRARDC